MKAIPDLPPAIKGRLTGLDRPLQANQVPSLVQALQDYVDSIARAAVESRFIDLPLVFRLQKSALEILNRYGELDPESRKAASTAVKYFLLRDDARNGFLLPGGFEDDAQVMQAASDFISARRAGMAGGEWAV